MSNSPFRINFLTLGSAFVLTGFSSVEANSIKDINLASAATNSTSDGIEIFIEKPAYAPTTSACNNLEYPSYLDCPSNNKNAYQPKDRLDRIVLKAAEYTKRMVPLLNSNSDSSAYSDLFINDGKNFVSDAGYGSMNAYANNQIQKIPFFAQTSVSINGRHAEVTSFTFDSLVKLDEMGQDDEGDPKTLLFAQSRLTKTSNSDGETANLGLGIRHRPNDEAMLGGNAFWDYRMVDYSNSHSRLGLGGEYFKSNWEFRNNWYMAITDEKSITIGSTSHTERVVPGWDAEVGYRFPNNPATAVFLKAFHWDYKDTNDNHGVEATLNWQYNPHLNWEAWIGNQISAGRTVVNSSLPNTNEVFFGLRFKWTLRPVKFQKRNVKQNLLTQMTQPVRRNYEVLLERSDGSFTNRAKGS